PGRGHPAWRRARCGSRRRARARAAAQDVAVERPRWLLGLGAQLALEPAHAVLILAERGGAPSLADIEPHGGAMSRLLQRIQAQDLECGLECRFCLARVHLAA